MTPIFVELRVDHAKARLVVFPPREAVPVYGHFVAPNPQKYVASLVLYGPLRAGIGRNANGWHCRRSSTLKKYRWREHSYVVQVMRRVTCRVRRIYLSVV